MTTAMLPSARRRAHDVSAGVIVDVENVEQALAAELAGAAALRLRLQRPPRTEPALRASQIREIVQTVAVPTIAVVQANHATEALVMGALGVKWIAPALPVTSPAPPWTSGTPQPGVFWPCADSSSALLGLRHGAAALFVPWDFEAQLPSVDANPLTRLLQGLSAIAERSALPSEARGDATRLRRVVRSIRRLGRLPVPCFCGGLGLLSPIDAALCVHWGADGVVLGSGVFHLPDPQKHIAAVAAAVRHPTDPAALLDALLRSEEAARFTDISHCHPASPNQYGEAYDV